MKKGKKKAVKDGAGGDESGSDYTDTSGTEESDLESEVEIPNDEVHDSVKYWHHMLTITYILACRFAFIKNSSPRLIMH